jgi:cyclic beta-1,2-glucan synthetase
MQSQDPSPLPDDESMFTAHVLSNGRMSTLLTANGGGFSALDGIALTRWVPDPTRDAYGVHIYVRDVERDVFWTTAGGPAPGAGHTLSIVGNVAELRTTAHCIECTTTICVSPGDDVELRRLTLRNAAQGTRTLEVTTCAELALNTLAADAAHPAFSKLFLQTGLDPAREALLAWRRASSPDDRPLWILHRLLCDAPTSEPGFETDRMRFVGRGRDRHNPAAVACGEMLSGTTGNVLDPIFSIRRIVSLEPGTSVTLVAVLAAAESRELVLHAADKFPHIAATAQEFAQGSVRTASSSRRTAVAASADASTHTTATQHDDVAALGLPKRWRELLHIGNGQDVVERRIPAPAAGSADGSVRRRSVRAVASATPTGGTEPLRFFNGWGGFSADATEYVIRMPLEDGVPRRPPMPWVNVMANETGGCIVSESGATSTWTANSRENRITPWFNDPVTDPHGEAIYLRDDDSGEIWSPTPGPAPGAGDYEVRHGYGYTRFLHASNGVVHDTVVFVPVHAPARIVRLRLANVGTAMRRLTLVSYAQLVLGTHEAETRGRVTTRHCSSTGALMARNDERGEFSDRVAFSSLVREATGELSWTTDRRAFLGDRGRMDAPAALAAANDAGTGRARLDGWTGRGRDPCFALSCAAAIAPGDTLTCAFVLGEASSEEEAAATVRAFARPHDIDAALEAVRGAWQERTQAVRIETPAPALDIMVNGWLTYQNLSCRMRARSAYYQSGGAFGFRDQLQDSSALLYIDPALTRHQILLHAAHQFSEGDVLHWWHPPLGKGIRTRFSDDLLWLPYVTAFYVGRTGDRAILDENVRYLRAHTLLPDDDEEFVVPDDAGESGSLYDHCCRALDRSLTTGVHGLPLMGAGDWNDGMNRVGREGRGESVWLGFFIFDILHAFLPLCVARGDHDRVAAYTAYHRRLEHALNDAGWDGEWYRRAFYDTGEPLGSALSDECRIDALAQSWAVMSGAATPERAAQALDSMEKHLVDEDAGLIRLLTPAFDRTVHDPGYIRGYLPGIRENGGQYTHGVLWAVRALAEHGRTERAARLLEMLSPVTRGGTPEDAERYMVEPYVVAADVYGAAPHIGRGGWTWYTGSAGWMYRIAMESILGLELRDGTTIALRPCIPASWPGFSIHLRLPDATVYDIAVERGDRSSITLDSEAGGFTNGALIVPLVRDGGRHVVRAFLGGEGGRGRGRGRGFNR